MNPTYNTKEQHKEIITMRESIKNGSVAQGLRREFESQKVGCHELAG
jgi:hypothetical protein